MKKLNKIISISFLILSGCSSGGGMSWNNGNNSNNCNSLQQGAANYRNMNQTQPMAQQPMMMPQAMGYGNPCCAAYAPPPPQPCMAVVMPACAAPNPCGCSASPSALTPPTPVDPNLPQKQQVSVALKNQGGCSTGSCGGTPVSFNSWN